MKQKTKTESKNTIFFLLVILTIAVVLLSMWAYSRYSDSFEGEANASIANWSFQVNGESEAISEINLLESMDDYEGVKKQTMAPGTGGKFSVDLDASGSDVSVGYKIKLYNLSGVPGNVKFYEENERGEKGTEISKSEDNSYVIEGKIDYDENAESSVPNPMEKTVGIFWEWEYQTKDDDADNDNDEDDYDTNDKEDTVDSAPNITGNISISGWQIKPENS